MKKLYLNFFVLGFVLTTAVANATVWTITSSGFTFSPAITTITLGDTVVFNIAGSHNAVEVSQATWNANGGTSNGGFMLPFGGGTVIPNQVKTYYYVCQPHAGMGMKGQIIVNNSTGIGSPASADGVLKFQPNPASDFTKIHTGLPEGITARMTVFDITGKLVFSQEAITNNYIFDLTEFNKGIYFVELRSEGYIRTAKLIVEQ